jgi:enoyl-CoA hydratase/carnithine racemase
MSDEVLSIRQEGTVAFLSFNRPAKRNAINDATVAALDSYFAAVPDSVRAIVLSGQGGHFSAGLDLSEQVHRSRDEVVAHSRNWHRVTGLMLNARVPVVAALSGAVMGGGLEIAACCHVRVADETAQFRMPEAQRGIFVGGGATVRLSAIIGADRLTEMMLTGRTYSAAEAVSAGIAHYAVPAGLCLIRSTDLANQIAANSRTINAMVIREVRRIAHLSPEEGLAAESLAAAESQAGPDAAEGLRAFLEKRKPHFP